MELQAGNPLFFLFFSPRHCEALATIYNSKITIENIPLKAYEYVVNGKSAIEWIIERYLITTHKKESGITNNPNDWAEEAGNPRHILDLLLSVINVSVQTVDVAICSLLLHNPRNDGFAGVGISRTLMPPSLRDLSSLPVIARP